MALDSATKRQAVPGVGRPWIRSQFPVSAKDRGWRSSVGLSYPVANFQVPSVAVGARTSTNHWLGRYWLGDAVPLMVLTRDNAESPTDPALAPYARIYSGTTFVKTVRLPKIDHAEITGMFLFLLRLDANFATGFYDVILDYVVSSVQRVKHLRFEITAGGDERGKAISMYYLRQPDRSFLISQLDTGQINKLQNPRFTP